MKLSDKHDTHDKNVPRVLAHHFSRYKDFPQLLQLKISRERFKRYVIRDCFSTAFLHRPSEPLVLGLR